MYLLMAPSLCMCKGICLKLIELAKHGLFGHPLLHSNDGANAIIVCFGFSRWETYGFFGCLLFPGSSWGS